MEKEAIERLFLLTDEKELLQGTKIVIMIRALKSSYYMVNRNYQELCNLISKYEESDISEIFKDKGFANFFKELSRLVHNYLSSTFSLIRHASRIQKKLTKLNHSTLQEEYNREVSALQSNDCYWFINDLRVITQHVELPILNAFFSREIDWQKAKQSIILDRKSLLLEVKDARSKRYVNTNQKIDLKVALKQYQALVKGFYKWFFPRVGKLYSKELKEYNTNEREINKCLTELFHKQ
jgi:hypothetical protein